MNIILDNFNKVEYVYVEHKIVCKWFGGTLDALFKIDDRIFLIDFKTSNYIITAEITPEMVNWSSTINNYLYYTLRHSFYPESEITLKRNAKPKILNVEYRDYNDELTR